VNGARPVPRWLSLVDASRNREHPPRKRNGSILPRKVAGSNPARGSTLQVRSTRIYHIQKLHEDSGLRSTQHRSRPNSDARVLKEDQNLSEQKKKTILRFYEACGAEGLKPIRLLRLLQLLRFDRRLVEKVVRQGN